MTQKPPSFSIDSELQKQIAAILDAARPVAEMAARIHKASGVDHKELVQSAVLHREAEKEADRIFEIINSPEADIGDLINLPTVSGLVIPYLLLKTDREARKNIRHLLKKTSHNQTKRKAKNAANARHKGDNEARARAIADWEAGGHTFSSVAAFARSTHKQYGMTDPGTVSRWITEHKKRNSR